MGSSNPSGNVTSGTGYPPVSISMGSYTPGILVIAYDNAGNNGVVMMPWGFSSLGFSMTFGGTPINQAWVATDLRQVQINGISYQAKLSLWSHTRLSGGQANMMRTVEVLLVIILLGAAYVATSSYITLPSPSNVSPVALESGLPILLCKNSTLGTI